MHLFANIAVSPVRAIFKVPFLFYIKFFHNQYFDQLKLDIFLLFIQSLSICAFSQK